MLRNVVKCAVRYVAKKTDSRVVLRRATPSGVCVGRRVPCRTVLSSLLPCTSSAIQSPFVGLRFYSTAKGAAMAATNGNSDKFSKLPELAKPRHYDITLKTDLVNFVFQGSETIKLEILKPTSFLKFHASEIEISEASLKQSNGAEWTKLPVDYDVKWETVTVKLPEELPKGDVTLTLKFTGILNDKMHGFYRSMYKTNEGETRYLASTQFESTYARLSFPCWDEPVYKATFDVTLVVNDQLTALSNMNVLSESKENGFKTVKYGTTPIMSTYLLAFAVGEFDYVETKTKDGVVMRVYALPGKQEQGRFALELATRAIEWYNEWFDIDYPLPKCDLIAIPDFCMGAMENWGLVTYREVALLVDPAKSSTRQKSRVGLIIAHELAHMWFGNLVTMKWWTDLWLKEGFASFMEYLFVGANYPEYKTWLHFVNDELAAGFGLDALKSSHPIEVTIDNPNELDEIYDNITYAKSNSVNRMLFSYLGEETFRNGLRIYLKKFQYNNATTVDLWDALSVSSGQDVNALMSPWTKQMGFPVVTVSQRQEGNKRVLKLSQKRFIVDGSDDPDNLLWQVPINISVSSNPEEAKFKILFTERETEVPLEGVSPDQWVKLNAATTGYYRVEYSEEMLQALLPAVKSKALPVVDRFGLANDLFALVKAGRVSAVQFLSLLSACSDEDEYTVWATLDGGVGTISNVLDRADDKAVKARFDAFVRKAYAPAAAKLGWDVAKDEDSQTSMLRALIHSRLGKAGDQATLETARAKFADHIENGTELHPDLRMMIYGLVGRNGGMEAYEQLRKMFEQATFGEVERHCLLAMAQSPESAVHKAAYEYGVDQGKVRSQDLMILFTGTTVTKKGQDFVWPYFKDNMKTLLEKFGGANNSLFQHVFKISCDGQCTEEAAKDIENFFRTQVDKDCAQTLDRPIRQITETIRVNGGLLKRNAGPIGQWLEANGF